MRGALALIFSVCASGCALTQPVPIARWHMDHNQDIAESERQMIVQNILRAHDQESMVFTRISQVQGSSRRTISGGLETGSSSIGARSPKGLIYTEDDGFFEDRLAKMDNRAKHFAEDTLNGNVSHPTPLWITTDGLACAKSMLSFAELAQLLEELGENRTFTARDILQKPH